MGVEYAADAPAAHRMALGLHFGPPLSRAIALAVVSKGRAHRDLPNRLGRRCLPAALSGIIHGRGHPQGLTELAHGPLAGLLSDVLVVGIPGFFGRCAAAKETFENDIPSAPVLLPAGNAHHQHICPS